MAHPVIQELNKKQMKKALPEFKVGDTIEVHVRVKEGEKERIQLFTGTCIARQGGSAKATFTVRRTVQGEGVERVFLIHSPNVIDVRVRHRGEVRRSKLYYLRDRTGKATRIKGRVVHEAEMRKASDAVKAAAAAAEAAEVAEAAEAASDEPEAAEESAAEDKAEE
jgi:large subunit ribosomal protein L19